MYGFAGRWFNPGGWLHLFNHLRLTLDPNRLTSPASLSANGVIWRPLKPKISRPTRARGINSLQSHHGDAPMAFRFGRPVQRDLQARFAVNEKRKRLPHRGVCVGETAGPSLPGLLKRKGTRGKRPSGHDQNDREFS